MPTGFARGNGFFSSVSPGLPAAHLPNRIFGGSPARVPRTIKSPWHHPAQPPLAQLASQGLVDHPIGLSTAPAPVQSVHCAHRPVMYIHMHVPALAHTESAGGTHTPPLSSPFLPYPSLLAWPRLASPRLAWPRLASRTPGLPSAPVADAAGERGRAKTRPRPRVPFFEIRNSDRVEFCRIRERNGQTGSSPRASLRV